MTAMPFRLHHERAHDVPLRHPSQHAEVLRRKAKHFEDALPELRWQLRIATTDVQRRDARVAIASCIAAMEEFTEFAELEERRAREHGLC